MRNPTWDPSNSSLEATPHRIQTLALNGLPWDNFRHGFVPCKGFALNGGILGVRTVMRYRANDFWDRQALDNPGWPGIVLLNAPV